MFLLSKAKNVADSISNPKPTVWEAYLTVHPYDGETGIFFERKIVGATRDEMWAKFLLAAWEVSEKLAATTTLPLTELPTPLHFSRWHTVSTANKNWNRNSGGKYYGGSRLEYANHVYQFLADTKEMEDSVRQTLEEYKD